jgi:molybdopterin converting factor small subunit
MIVVLIAVTLFSFIRSSGKGEAFFGDVHIAESVIAREDAMRFNLFEAGKRALIESYGEMAGNIETATDGELIGKLKDKVQKDSIFGGKGDNIIVEGKNNSFSFSMKGVVYMLSTKDANEDTKAQSVGVNYKTDVTAEIDLRNEGLHSFGDIRDAGQECVKQETNPQIEECLGKKLFNFDVKVEPYSHDKERISIKRGLEED